MDGKGVCFGGAHRMFLFATRMLGQYAKRRDALGSSIAR
jgi:hypothetical protein